MSKVATLLALDRLVYYTQRMNKHTEHDTREHLLATGEQLCLQRGFTGMGLSELPKTAEVPKGSFITTFVPKEAFGVAMLERHYAAYHQRLTELLQSGEGNYRDRILAYYPANTEPVLPTWNHQWLPDSKTLCRSVRSVRRYAQRNG